MFLLKFSQDILTSKLHKHLRRKIIVIMNLV